MQSQSASHTRYPGIYHQAAIKSVTCHKSDVRTYVSVWNLQVIFPFSIRVNKCTVYYRDVNDGNASVISRWNVIAIIERYPDRKRETRGKGKLKMKCPV